MLTSEGRNPSEPKPGLKSKLRQAFAVGSEYEEKLLDDEEQLLQDIARNIQRRGLVSVAIPFLLVNKPLNVLGANMVQFGAVVFTAGPVERFLRSFMGSSYTHELFVRTLEKRCSMDRLVEILESLIDERP
jgi:hypothetical protein